MNNIDLIHNLQSGNIIYLENIPTYKVSLKDMVELGFSQTSNVISFLCLPEDEAQKFIKGESLSPAFDALCLIIAQELSTFANDKKDINDTFYFSVISFLTIFFKKPVAFDFEFGFIIGDDDGEKFILNSKNYGEFQKIIKERNCLASQDETYSDNPADERTKQLIEKRKQLREKLKKAKTGMGDDTEITMADLISIFAQAQQMPLQDVYYKYDVYQFNDQFNRLKIMDDFRIDIQALLAGAKKEDVKLRHWLTKINITEN